MILVTGSTGNVGGALVEQLAGGREAVRALVRGDRPVWMPRSVDAVRGDLDVPTTLSTALHGVRAVFLLAWSDALTATLERLEAAGVERVVMLTSRCVVGGDPSNAVTRRWLDAEAALRATSMSWTVVRPSGFHSNALRWRAQLDHGNVIRAAWPDVPIASIDPRDIAAVVAAELTGEGHPGSAVSLSGPQPLRPVDQIATLSVVLGRPLVYEPLDDDVARSELLQTTPPDVVDALFRFFSDGEFDDSTVLDAVERLTGRPARTFEEWARANVDRFTSSLETGVAS